MTGQGEAVRVRGVVATADLFPLLGATADLGRSFLPEEDNAGGGAQGYPVILGWGSWQRYFGGDPHVIGRSITLSGSPYTVIGVMPAGFSFPVQAQPVEFWISPARDAERTGEGAIMVARGYRGWRVVGRLADGATVPQAQAEADVVAANQAAQFADANRDLGIKVMPLQESLVGNQRLTLLLLFGVVGVVLLIACANVANLLLERAVSRPGRKPSSPDPQPGRTWWRRCVWPHASVQTLRWPRSSWTRGCATSAPTSSEADPCGTTRLPA